MKNIDLAYGDTLTRKEKKNILKKSLINLALVGAELPHQILLATKRRDELCTLKGGEHIDQFGNGIMIGAHFSNWEWAFGIFCGAGYKTACIVRPFRDPRMNKAIDDFRSATGVETIEKKDAATQSMKALREGKILAMLVDQSTRKNGVSTTFFGQPCWSTVGPAILALRAKVPIYPMSLIRDDKGFYTMEILSPIIAESTGNLSKDILCITQKCQDAIEEIIRANPEQWMWVHDRWKEQPNLEKEWAERKSK